MRTLVRTVGSIERADARDDRRRTLERTMGSDDRRRTLERVRLSEEGTNEGANNRRRLERTGGSLERADVTTEGVRCTWLERLRRAIAPVRTIGQNSIVVGHTVLT